MAKLKVLAWFFFWRRRILNNHFLLGVFSDTFMTEPYFHLDPFPKKGEKNVMLIKVKKCQKQSVFFLLGDFGEGWKISKAKIVGQIYLWLRKIIGNFFCKFCNTCIVKKGWFFLLFLIHTVWVVKQNRQQFFYFFFIFTTYVMNDPLC